METKRRMRMRMRMRMLVGSGVIRRHQASSDSSGRLHRKRGALRSLDLGRCVASVSNRAVPAVSCPLSTGYGLKAHLPSGLMHATVVLPPDIAACTCCCALLLPLLDSPCPRTADA